MLKMTNACKDHRHIMLITERLLNPDPSPNHLVESQLEYHAYWQSPHNLEKEKMHPTP